MDVKVFVKQPGSSVASGKSSQGFFDGLFRYVPPSPEEERELLLRVFEGDEKAKHELVLRNFRLVLKLAREYYRRRNPEYSGFDDLLQAGVIALYEAVERFNAESHETRFSTYAVWWIKHYFDRELIEMEHPTSVTPYAFKRLGKYRSAFIELVNRLGRKPSYSEVASFCDWTDESVREWQLFGQNPVFLDAVVSKSSEEGDCDSIGMFLRADSGEGLVVDRSDKEMLHRIIRSELLPFERDMIFQFFGFNGGERKKLSEIGESYGLTAVRAQTVINAALRRIRRRLLKEGCGELGCFI